MSRGSSGRQPPWSSGIQESLEVTVRTRYGPAPQQRGRGRRAHGRRRRPKALPPSRADRVRSGREADPGGWDARGRSAGRIDDDKRLPAVLEPHRELLADAARVHAFEHALRARVRPGDVVVDLASGTGILGMLACRAGASRVYAIESSGIVEVAQRLARVNGYADRIRVLQSAVDDAELPEAPDGIVADQIGHFGYEAGLFEMFARARTWLKPGGWMVPQRIQFVLAPVTDDAVRARVASWASPVAGLDFSAASSFAANAIYPQTLDCDQLLD